MSLLSDCKRIIRAAFEANMNSYKKSESSGETSLERKFRELYCFKNRNALFRPGSSLKIIVEMYELNCLVVKLHPRDIGYDLFFRIGKANNEDEMLHFTYDNDVILSYINNGELIAPLQDLFHCLNFLYSGHIIVEIQDNRESYSKDQRYVLLKPTTETILQDLSVLERQQQNCKKEQKIYQRFFLSNSEKLCLCPSPLVSLISNRISNDNSFVSISSDSSKTRDKYSDEPLLQSDIPPKKGKFSNLDFVSLQKCVKSNTHCPTSSEDRAIELVGLHQKSFSMLERLRNNQSTSPMNLVTDVTSMYSKKLYESYVIQELILDCSENKLRTFQEGNLQIKKCPRQEMHYGQLLVAYNNYIGSPCSDFVLGTRTNVKKFIKKYIQIFTEQDSNYSCIVHYQQGGQKIFYTPKAALRLGKWTDTSRNCNNETIISERDF